MNWERRDSYSDNVENGLSTEVIREGLFRNSFTPEDWVRREGEATWRQLATVDEFATSVSGSRRRRVRPLEEDDGLDMTPMIDCTFLLLIFFMITASFHLQKGLDFPPDKTQASSTDDPQLPGIDQFTDRLFLEISEDDQLTLKSSPDDATGADRVTPAELVQALKKLARDTKKTSVLIMAHELASHEAVVLAIDCCGQAGLRDVSLADVSSQRLPVGADTTILRE